MKSAIFALAAAAALTACVKGGEVDPSKTTAPGARIDATIRLTQHGAHSRNYSSLVPDGTAVELMDAWVVFTTGSDDAATVSAVYTLLRQSSGQPLTVAGGKVNDDGTVTLNNVPDTSASVMIFSNFSTIDESQKPVVGEKVGALKARFGSLIDLHRIKDALHVPALGQSKLADTDDAKKKSANVSMDALSSRIQVKSFDSSDVSVDKIELFLNKINCQSGNAASWLDTADPALYVSGSTQYPAEMYGLTHDEIGSLAHNYQLIPSGGKGWCYNLIGRDKMPHIVLKLTGVTVYPLAGDTPLGTLADPQFITVAGFRDKAGNKIETMEPGSIYTIEAISISSEKLTPLPSAKPIEVTVSVSPVKWSDNTVNPEY